MPSPAAIKPPRDRSVFINCSFDGTYQPLFRAMCFAIMACGYLPRCDYLYLVERALPMIEAARAVQHAAVNTASRPSAG
jgi:hypothetical protein